MGFCRMCYGTGAEKIAHPECKGEKERRRENDLCIICKIPTDGGARCVECNKFINPEYRGYKQINR